MSAGPAYAPGAAGADTHQIASSAVVVGTARFGEESLLAEGAVVRSFGTGVDIGTGSAVLENSVVIGTSKIPTSIGRRSVFGHRCMAVGAAVGDLCEIGNASVLMPGARVGDRVFLGEGTLVPAGMTLPSDVVAVGRPARVVRTASADDMDRLAGMRGGDLSIPARTAIIVEATPEKNAMGQLYAYRDIVPRVAPSATLFSTAEITGDVVVGERTIIGAGSVIEPGAIVCDHSVLGAGCVVGAGAVVKQRSRFAAGTEIDGFPAVEVGRTAGPPEVPAWAWQADELPVPIASEQIR